MTERFLLIPGRTSKQGCGISEGKHTSGYQAETATLQMAPEDLARLGLEPGAHVRLSNAGGEVEVQVTAARAGELQPGMVFIAYGEASSRLMGADTEGSGMPTSKGIEVALEKIP